MYEACVSHFEADLRLNTTDQCLINNTVRLVCRLCEKTPHHHNSTYNYCCYDYLQTYSFCEAYDTFEYPRE
uniref:SV_SVC-Lyc-1 n=1 Tax=Lychas buchari TaxID=1330406 RepID=T1E6Y6_9SCOR